ncbi:MAG: glutamate synthase large subunit [Legionellaceae bacterium]|nr:glutamate synthase large subunit [Legionellaceae bacterium]
MNQEQDSCGFGLLVNTHSAASHRLISQALTGLSRLTHRGAVGEDGLAGDGCGIMLQLDQGFFRKLAAAEHIALPPHFALGMCFLEPQHQQAERQCIENTLAQEGLSVAGWRAVPVETAVLSKNLQASLPEIVQCFIGRPANMPPSRFEKKLYIVQKRCEWHLRHHGGFSFCSLSSHSVVYKALVLPANLAGFYPDLQQSSMKAQIALFHQRFSTNTLSNWQLAQPFSTLAHNGEINTVQGNRFYLRQISHHLSQQHFPALKNMDNLISESGSDSQSLDQFIQCLRHCGLSSAEALRICIPPAWEHHVHITDAERDYFRFHAPLLPSWEGPAAIVFYDGHYAGCILDRNGFRPARWQEYADGLIFIGSEVGLVDGEVAQLKQQSRLQPGELLLIDTLRGERQCHDGAPPTFYQRYPYSSEVSQGHFPLHEHDDAPASETPPLDSLCQKAFDLSYEEIEQSLRYMAYHGIEPTSSMGDDTPLAALSYQPRQLFDFMRQQFAQVTNPPLDSLRERSVMSSELSLGSRQFTLPYQRKDSQQIILPSPLLSQSQFLFLSHLHNENYRACRLSLHYDAPLSLSLALDQLTQQAEQCLGAPHHCLIILDDEPGASLQRSIHPALAVGALHHSLTRSHHRSEVSLIVASGWVRDAHHLAMLIASGANAVFPWLAYQVIAGFTDAPLSKMANYRQALTKGLLKICSKMGVCTLNSYQGSQLFQVLGLHRDIIERCFSRSAYALERYDWHSLQSHQERFWEQALDISIPTRHGGLYKYVENSEYHDYHPAAVTQLIHAVKTQDHQEYQSFTKLVQQRKPVMLRDFFALASERAPIALAQVEAVEQITSRFETAAMSLGALSPEAHESLAQAMNALGGRSNSGEGGEADYRHGTDKRSKIKQIASGRFGVTAAYLMQAEVIQIKIAQGAKPGEGGQLPGVKVNPLIARLRYCSPGVTLISPPPHHDIYSIEDLAQLIFDLKQLNPQAYISVKLVCAPGVGTIAAGVVKAYADCITLSGYDGGTGASPLTSIRYTGCPWEMGLLETQSVLLENQLRHRVCLQIDGGLKTGLDVIKAALLGAETFGFGTAPMVALGCKYLRICHLNNCATGVATQDETLRREYYQGDSERVKQYFQWVAEDVREALAQLGYTRLTDIIGRHDLLRCLPDAPLPLPPVHPSQHCAQQRARLYQQPRNPSFDQAELAQQIWADVATALPKGQSFERSYAIYNHCRSIGANIAGAFIQHGQGKDRPAAQISLHFQGNAGQSFAAWLVEGMELRLTGAANDYVGKGMNGGLLVLMRPAESPLASRDYCIAGNTCLYGATGGECYMDGVVGERFAVRNSGAQAVVAGAGFHACEYMTAGVVVILDTPAPNFAAGMTGGLAFVWDRSGYLAQHINTETVEYHALNQWSNRDDHQTLYALLQQFQHHTHSSLGAAALTHLDQGGDAFYVIAPKDQAAKSQSSKGSPP